MLLQKLITFPYIHFPLMPTRSPCHVSQEPSLAYVAVEKMNELKLIAVQEYEPKLGTRSFLIRRYLKDDLF